MSEDDSLVEEFFSEVNDKYYPQVLEGIDLLDENQIEKGIEVLSRPLHTIKGVTGFMSGFEPASGFTHKVESFLKKMQAGEIKHELPQIALAIESVNSIFMLIEQLRESGSYDTAMTDDIESRLAGKSGGEAGAQAVDSVTLEIEKIEGDTIITLLAKRIYRQDRLDAVKDSIAGVEAGRRIIFDFTETISVGSSLFEIISEYTDKYEIGITGMNGFCSSTFYSWGFQRYLSVFDSKKSFLG